MKGIVHFLSGLAAATFFPEAVNLAATQSSFILVLGGIGGLLPDTLDFRLSRFLEKPDVDIDPHPAHLDPQDIAERVAEAINRAARTRQKLIIQLRTMRLGPDRWRQYSLRFDVASRAVIVTLGPTVNTSQMRVPEGREKEDAVTWRRGDAESRGRGNALLELPPRTEQEGHVENVSEEAEAQSEASAREGRASVDTPFSPTYGPETMIDIFSGPSFALEWRRGQVEINFIPWHRQWSHSLTFAALLGVLAGILFGATAGAITAVAFTVHIAEDQFGFLGSNLFFPFTRRRLSGFKWVHSGDPLPNFISVWVALLIILFNLDRFSPQPLLNPLPFFGLAGLPVLILLCIYLVNRRRTDLRNQEAVGALQQTDLLQETQQVIDA